jgi:hypothetical protein
MNSCGKVGPLRDNRGQSLVEFALCISLLATLLFATVDLATVFLVYASISNTARMDARYAIFHEGSLPPSAPNASASQVCPSPGCLVTVTVSYPYQLPKYLRPYFRNNTMLTLQSTSQGVITH